MARGKHVEVYRGRGIPGWYRFRLVAGNGEKETASQPYRAHRGGVPNLVDSRNNARKGARRAHPGVRIRVV